MPLDRDRLTKLLKLAASENDHEALGCIRAATRLLKENDMTWEQVLAGEERVINVSIVRTTEPADFDQPPHLSDTVMIDLMFRSIYAQPRTGNESFWGWLDDVHEKWQRYGRLSQGQYTGVRNTYRRTMSQYRDR